MKIDIEAILIGILVVVFYLMIFSMPWLGYPK